jgi:predicted PurR-regulated permease PerM
LKKYLVGFMKILIINFFLYSFAFFIVGHPNALLLGFMASVASLVPYFGGIFTNVIALVTAFVVSPALFIKTLIAVAVLSVLDGNVISPLVYGKSNEIHPLLIILAIFAGGLLFGMVGIILALPLSIIAVTTVKYFKSDISEIIDDMKEDKKSKK